MIFLFAGLCRYTTLHILEFFYISNNKRSHKGSASLFWGYRIVSRLCFLFLLLCRLQTTAGTTFHPLPRLQQLQQSKSIHQEHLSTTPTNLKLHLLSHLCLFVYHYRFTTHSSCDNLNNLQTCSSTDSARSQDQKQEELFLATSCPN